MKDFVIPDENLNCCSSCCQEFRIFKEEVAEECCGLGENRNLECEYLHVIPALSLPSWLAAGIVNIKTDSRARLPGFKSQLYYLLAV